MRLRTGARSSLDYRIEKTRSVVSETDHYVGGYPIDSCAVIAALK